MLGAGRDAPVVGAAALGALCAGVAGETHAAGRSSSPLDANMSSAKSDASPGDPALKWFQGALNSEVYLPGGVSPKYWRVSADLHVNNISATLLSDRFDLAALFVARAAEHMAKVPLWTRSGSTMNSLLGTCRTSFTTLGTPAAP